MIPAIRRCIGIAQVHLLLLATQARPNPVSLDCVSFHAASLYSTPISAVSRTHLAGWGHAPVPCLSWFGTTSPCTSRLHGCAHYQLNGCQPPELCLVADPRVLTFERAGQAVCAALMDEL